MRRERSPDDRYIAALNSPHEPANGYEALLWRHKVQNVPDDVLERVVDIYEDNFEREMLQAWIIAGASDEDISTRGGMSIDVLAPYRHLCCNVFAFRDRFELMRWLGRFVSESSEHTAEYTPYFLRRDDQITAFDVPVDERYDRALKLLGLEAWMISPDAGHA